MKLSIITINRNNAEGLRKTIESVLSQTYRNLEYIVIDGASSDDSVNVIKELESEGIRELETFQWISEPDTGIYNAMNKGIKKATGEYLLFLNSGDFLIAPDVIERVMTQYKGADILCAKCNVSNNGKVEWTSTPPAKVTFGTLYLQGLPHQATFIKRSLFETCGLYREDLRYNSDIAFWYKSIIEYHASTEPIDVITTDYNLDGVSAQEKYSANFIAEQKEILAPYALFTADYDVMKSLQGDLILWSWVKRHKMVYNMVKLMYKIGK